MPSTTKKGMWMDETLEIAMDVVERGSHFEGGPTCHGTSQ
jgi:hypothetical protein